MTNEELYAEFKKLDETSTLRDFQKYEDNMIKTRGFEDETPQDVMLLMIEEVGELAKEVRKTTQIKMDENATRQTDLKGEITDVFHYLLALCRVTNIDLLEAFQDKEERNFKRLWK